MASHCTHLLCPFFMSRTVTKPSKYLLFWQAFGLLRYYGNTHGFLCVCMMWEGARECHVIHTIGWTLHERWTLWLSPDACIWTGSFLLSAELLLPKVPGWVVPLYWAKIPVLCCFLGLLSVVLQFHVLAPINCKHSFIFPSVEVMFFMAGNWPWFAQTFSSTGSLTTT